MARIAVIFSVILSLFLLYHACHDPSTALSLVDALKSSDRTEVLPQLEKSLDPFTAVSVQDPQANTDQTTTVLLPVNEFSDASIPIVDPDLSRRISHSLRLPINRHAARRFRTRLGRGCRGQARVFTRVVEIPYGDDMVGKRRPFRMRATGSLEQFRKIISGLVDGTIKEEDVRGWNPEAEHKKKERKEGREEGGFTQRFREFFYRF